MGILHLGERQRLRLFVRRDTLRALPLLPRLRPARPLQHREPAPHRGDPARRVRRRERSTTRRASPSRCSCGCTTWSTREPGARCPTSTPREIELHARGRDALVGRRPRARRCVERARRGARQRAAPPLRRRVPHRLPRRLGRPLGGRPTSAASRRSRRTTTWRSRLYRPLEAGRRARCARSSSARAGRSRSRTCCPCSRTWACRSPTSAPTRSRRASGEPAWIYDFGLDLPRRRRLRRRRRSARPSRTPSSAPGAATSRTTATTGSCCARGLTWREVTVLRAVGALPAPGRHDVQRPLRRGRAGRAPATSRGLLVELFRARFDPDARRRARRAERSSAEIEEAIDAVESLDQDRILRRFLARRPGDAAHQLLPARATTASRSPTCRSSSTRRSCRWLPAAAARVRDLRLLAAHRGRAPARRQGRARRPALVGPARGLPHRGARPDEGADGQERGDRARSGAKGGFVVKRPPEGGDREALLRRGRGAATGPSSAACST